MVADVTSSRAGELPVDAGLPTWVSARLRYPATWTVLGAAIIVGLAADQALRVGAFGVGASVTLLVGCASLIGVGRLSRVEARALVIAAALFAVWLTFRASPWLVWPDLLATVGLMGLAASFAVPGSLRNLGAAELGARMVQAAVHISAGAGFAVRPVLRARSRARAAVPVARGLLIASPIAIVIGALLASADPVFASFFSLNVDVGRLLLDMVFVVFGAFCMAGLLRLAASEPLDRIDGPSWRLGATETLVVLAVLDAVFAAFAMAQVLAATGAAANTLRSAGVTYSDYARSGFFQLLWVSGITLALLFLFSRITRVQDARSRVAFMILAQFAIALTLMIDVVAFGRLSLYETAYGFTMLRLYSHVFAAWIALVFVLLALDFLGVGKGRRWFVGSAVVSALGVLLALNIANPEAVVVALNTNHAQSTHKLDLDYLATLSSDATPALLQSGIRKVACVGPRDYAPPPAAFNWSDAEAATARRAGC